MPAVFNDNGAGVRGDLAAVIRAVLTHPEAGLSSVNSGKLSEPVLFIVSQLRALNASVTDHPFMSDKAEEMGQKVFYPGSVFSYFSPGFRVRGTVGPTGLPLGGPEFQILTSVTALVRANFVGSLLGGHFGADVAFDNASVHEPRRRSGRARRLLRRAVHGHAHLSGDASRNHQRGPRLVGQQHPRAGPHRHLSNARRRANAG